MSKHQKRPANREESAADESSTGAAFDDVLGLVKERRKYVDWIATLEAKKAQTPPQVYKRVHADYEKRLAAVVQELASHRSTLESEQESLTRRLVELETE